eukprot:UN24790
MADTKQTTSLPKTWFVKYESWFVSYERFLNNRIAEFGSQLCFSKSTRWARVDRRYKYVSNDDLPVGLTKKQRSSLAIVIGLKNANVDVTNSSCLQKSCDLGPHEYHLINRKGEKVSFKNEPIVVTTRVLSAPRVKSLRKPRKVPTKAPEKNAWKSWISMKQNPSKPIKSTKNVKPLSFAQNLTKIVRENYRGFCINKNVRSVRPVYNKETKRAYIVITLTNAEVDFSSLTTLSLDENTKPKGSEFINEYFLLDPKGRKVTFNHNKKPVKIQTRLHNIKVQSLAKPSNRIGERIPSKKHAKTWTISVEKKKSSSRLRAFKDLVEGYTKEICSSKMIHWLRPGRRWEGVSEEEMKNVSKEETKNNIAIFVGIRNSKVCLSDIKCLKLDEKSSSGAWINEYFLVDSEDKNIKINDQCVKVQTRIPSTLLSRKNKGNR